jgi:hypothetical protein
MTQVIFYTKNGRLDPESEQPIEDMLARLSAAENPRLLLFVHGGLVSENDGVKTAIKLASAFAPLASAGWETGFPIWRSSIGETIWNNHDELAREPRFQRILFRLIEWLDRRLGKGVIDKAFVDTGSVERALGALEAASQPSASAIEAMLTATGDLERTLNVEGLSDQHLEDTELARSVLADSNLVALLETDLPMMDPAVQARAQAARLVAAPQSAKSAAVSPSAWVVAIAVARVGFRVLKRSLQDRDHGLGPTVVEELIGALYLDKAGASIWAAMKNDARQHFAPGGAGSRLLEGVSNIARSGKTVRVMTIGHSAGSLFASQLAREAARAPANLVCDFVLLAPAIRIDEAAEQFGSGRVNGFRIFTMDDQRERANRLDGNPFGKIYHRSLLYLISGVLERKAQSRYADAPLLGLQRHLAPEYRPTGDERAALNAARSFLSAAPDRIVYAHTAGSAAPGRTSMSSLHGGYWGDPQTLDSVRWIAQRGYVD